jgi:HlyD family secretion protein
MQTGLRIDDSAGQTPEHPAFPRLALWTLLVVVVVGLGYLAYTLLLPTAPITSPVSVVPVKVGSIQGVVDTTGQISPWSESQLAFQVSGKIATLPVRAGDVVKQGQVLATLDTTDLRLQLEQSQANLETAQAKLEAIQAGPRPQDVLAAQADLAAQQAKLAGMLAGGRPESVAAAQASLASAQAKLHLLTQPPLPADVAADQTAVNQARSTLAQAQANLAALTRPADPLVIHNDLLAVEAGKDAVWAAQTNRDSVCGGNASSGACQAQDALVAAAQTGLDEATAKLQIAQEPPHPEDVTAAQAAVASAQAGLASAQAKLAQLQAGPLPDDVAQAQAAVDAAEQTLALQRQPYSASDLDQQRQAVAAAQANLALKQAPYTQSDLDQAKAAVDQAKAQVDLAQSSVDQATLRAPFDGVVSSVSTGVGELAGGPLPNPIISLVDPTNLHLDASVDETDIARVAVGQPARVTFDALRGQTFSGKVTSIHPNAVVQSGVATYVVSISLNQVNGVRPGMSATAQIIYAQHDHALLVPATAVRPNGNGHLVSLMEGNQPVAQPVTIGISDGVNTEILSGLKAGDEVLIPATAPSPSGFISAAPTRTP